MFGSMKTLPAIQKMLVSPSDLSTRPVGRALWEESLALSKIHSSIRADEWNFCPLVLVQPRKTCPCLTERLLMGRKESNQTKTSAAIVH